MHHVAQDPGSTFTWKLLTDEETVEVLKHEPVISEPTQVTRSPSSKWISVICKHCDGQFAISGLQDHLMNLWVKIEPQLYFSRILFTIALQTRKIEHHKGRLVLGRGCSIGLYSPSFLHCPFLIVLGSEMSTTWLMKSYCTEGHSNNILLNMLNNITKMQQCESERAENPCRRGAARTAWFLSEPVGWRTENAQ